MNEDFCMGLRCLTVAALTQIMLAGSLVRAEEPWPSKLESFLESHCVDCHDGPEADGGLDFYELGFDLRDQETARRWILVHDKLAAGEMPPPQKKDRPDALESKAIQKLLGESIVNAEKQRSDVVLRRLNRREYENTVRDLFQIEVSVTGLPEDSSTDGFDNVGEGLAVSAEAMQAYLEAADQVLDAVFGPPEKPKFIRHETNLLDQVDWKGNPQLEKQIGKMFRRTDDGLVIFQSNYCPTNLVNFARLRAPAGTYRGTIKARAIQSDKPVTLRIYAGRHHREPAGTAPGWLLRCTAGQVDHDRVYRQAGAGRRNLSAEVLRDP